MSNVMYGKGLGKFLTKDIDYINDRIMVSLVSLVNYTPQFDVDEFLSDIPANTIIASEVLTGKATNSLGVADADDIIFNSVSGLVLIDAVIVWFNTFIVETSPLILFYDDSSNLPITPNGDNVSISWSDDVNKIFKL
jgi:hypothetical protein